MGGEVTKKDRSTGSHFPIVTISGLDVSILSGIVNAANIMVNVDGVKLTMADDYSNYVYIDWNDNTIKSNTTGFPNVSLELYIITSAAGVIDRVKGIEDRRGVLRMAAHSEYKTIDGALIYDVFNENQDWTLLDLSAIAPDCATAIFLNAAVNDSGTPSINVYTSFRKPGESGLGREATIYPQVSGLYCSATAVIGMDELKQIEYKVKVSGTFILVAILSGWLFGRC